MSFPKSDVEFLRTLGRQVAEIAALPDQQRTIQLWKQLNGLKPARPMVAIDQIPWHEMNVNGELTLQCTGPDAKKVETDLRRRLYRWRHMRADYVVENTLGISPVLAGTDIGPKVEEDRAVGDRKTPSWAICTTTRFSPRPTWRRSPCRASNTTPPPRPRGSRSGARCSTAS